MEQPERMDPVAESSTPGSSPDPAPEPPPLPGSGTEAAHMAASPSSVEAHTEAAAIFSETPRPPVQPQPFVFHGTTRDYFRIWIVNTLLTLLTLGVFFAWAKVRKRRYLRGCCELMGHRFDYRADPRRILLGNVIAVTLFFAYSVFGAVYPAVQLGTLGVGLLLLPWIVTRAYSFNAHNTVYRGLRFRFHGSLSAAAWTFLLRPLALIVSVGLYYPAWARARREYVVTNHRLGDAYFRFTAATRPYYAAYLAGGAIVLGSGLMAGIVVGVVSVWTGMGPVPPHWLAVMIPLLIYGGGFYLSRHLVHAWLFNHVWNHTFLDDHRFEARMNTGRWLGLQVTNLLAIIGSFGLLVPWATIRTNRYTASCLSFILEGSIDRIERMGSARGSATGDSAAEIIGLDFGL